MNSGPATEDRAVEALPLALGTAQLGMDYGIANRLGRPRRAEAFRMVQAFVEHGGRWFDTARAYGESEAVLGYSLRELGVVEKACVVTKLARRDLRSADAARAAVQESQSRLGARPWGILLHNEDLLDDWERGVGEILRRLRRESLTDHLGISVYSVGRARQALEIDDLDVLQMPGSVFDRRMLRSRVLDKARERGVMVFIRSVYLQGLVLMEAAGLPPRLSFARKALNAYAQFCRNHGLERDAFALAYARGRFGGTTIVGAESADQVERNCRLVREGAFPGVLLEAWDRAWPEDQEKLIDPSRWPQDCPPGSGGQ